MHSRCARAALSIGAGLAFVTAMHTPVAADPPTDALHTELQRAKFTVVGTVTETRPSRRRSSWGDVIIVTTAILHTDEALRGSPPSWVPLELEGGTIDGVTMEASHTPLLKRGDRAVFLVDQLSDGRFVAHGRGAGVLRLRSDDRIEDSALTLNDVRRLAGEGR
jgi:hypothetical protein